MVLVNTHGRKGSGNFLDKDRTDEFDWTPERLWDGYGQFQGLKRLLRDHWPSKPAIIVLAQCYGRLFANALSLLAGNMAEIVGLSETETYSIPDPAATTMGTIIYHRELLDWFIARFGSAVPSAEQAQPAPALSGLFMLATQSFSAYQDAIRLRMHQYVASRCPVK